jgi:hypothetical protein
VERLHHDGAVVVVLRGESPRELVDSEPRSDGEGSEVVSMRGHEIGQRGTAVKRGEVFADVADMAAKTHLHFAVFNGDYEPHAWNGTLPPVACSGFPVFPYRFIDANVFLETHLAPMRLARGTRF